MIQRIATLFIFVIALQLHAETFVAGKDYTVLNQTSSTTKPSDKIEFLEFFSYGCPWCYTLEQPIQEWMATHQDVAVLKRAPVVFHPEWQIYAKAFYTAKLLGIEHKMTPLLFAAVQKQKLSFNTSESMIAFFVQNGVDESTARSAFLNSPTIDLEMKEGLKLMGQYRIQAVPAMVINGQYKTDLQMAQSVERFILILDFLLQKSQQPAE